MHKKLFNIMIVLLLAFFCFSGCYQMGRTAERLSAELRR